MANMFALHVVRRVQPLVASQLISFTRRLTHIPIRHKSHSILFTGHPCFTQQLRRCSTDGTDVDEPVEPDSGLEDIARPEEHDEILAEDPENDAQYVPDESPPEAEHPDEEAEPTTTATTPKPGSMLKLEPCTNPPTRFSSSFSVGTKVYTWHTTAKYGRRLIGPMMEWAQEFTYRTGVSVQWDATYPEKIFVPPSGTPESPETEQANPNAWYNHRDDVEVTVYFFGSQRAIDASITLIEEMIAQEPALVRVGIFKRQENGAPPLWLGLRRVNNETRPADIPAISLKTPGKFTLLFETLKEAAVRSVFEETGIRLNEDALTPTGYLDSMGCEFFWRAKVHYFVAELPADAEILGPRTSVSDYFVDWDSNILRQSPDPIDRVWANYADPKTGCAWITAAKMDELQLPTKGENYMEIRYKVGDHLPELREATQI